MAHVQSAPPWHLLQKDWCRFQEGLRLSVRHMCFYRGPPQQQHHRNPLSATFRKHRHILLHAPSTADASTKRRRRLQSLFLELPPESFRLHLFGFAEVAREMQRENLDGTESVGCKESRWRVEGRGWGEVLG